MTFRGVQVSFWLLSILAWAPSTSSSSVEAAARATGDVELPKAESPNEPVLTTADHGKLQIEWLRSKGGFVNSKLEIRRADPNDPTSPFGMFANEDIDEDDTLLSIPRECLITSELEEPDWVCTTTRNLVREMKLGNASAWAPYVNYLKSQPYGQLPSHWSEPARELLDEVVGDPSNPILPPSDPSGWIDDEWKNECDGGDDLFEQNAFLLVTQRGWDDLLIPVYDMMSHRNGKWLNTRSLGVRNEVVEVQAKKAIRAGEEIYTSYDQCEDCGGRADSYGTPEIFRDYGFTEIYPQRWHFHDQGISFVLDANDDNGLELEWLSAEPDEDEIEFFEGQAERLRELMDGKLSIYNEGISQSEQLAIREFTDAMITAMDTMITIVKGMDCTSGEDTCIVSSARYSALDEAYEDYDITTCDREVSLDYSEYATIEEVQSHYQYNTFIKHPETHNVCFDLDDIYQQCTSYRPHYHEVFVHYTARFLPEIKRVLWVGGGDSMLLHEILKYPSLEVAIGLELDQMVTRWAFKHFGSQPHWDNDKVQWWYGDAAKSLLMLPKEYFGSFDMVLVDLSETVMSALVTKELDIMAALSLLLKPDGIFVKNELYFEKLNSLFKYTIQINYYDVPAICSQTMVFGSNSVDFVKTTLTDHKVETLFAPMEKIDQNFEIVHDYKNNPSAQRHCKTDDDDKIPETQDASPGIVLILEAENASSDISHSDKVEVLIRPALESQGLHVVSMIKSDEKEVSVVAMLHEGYVVARAFPESRYVAFDIHLWTSFDKFESIKKSLLTAVGSDMSSSSNFRIVATGMFGLTSWVDDSMSRGPKFTQECDDVAKLSLETPMDSTTSNDIIGKISRSWVSNIESGTSVVFCGPKTERCASIEAFETDFKTVMPVYTCSNIAAGVEYLEDSANLKFACEQEIIVALETLVSENGKIAAIALDPSAPFAMAQIVHKIVSRRKLTESLLPATGPIVIAPMHDATEKWRRMFVDSFRQIYQFSPADVANLVFNTTESTIEISLFVTGDEDFIVHTNDLVSYIEKKTGVVGEIKLIGGGRFDWQGDDWKPSQFFLPGAYDQKAPLEQWYSQQPVGHQSVIQLQAKDGQVSKENVKEMLDGTLGAMSINSETREFTEFGEGSAVVGLWSEGSAIVLYDGRSHISINLFTYEQDKEFVTKFSDNFKEMDDELNVILFDEMPRGYGRVVNWSKDIGSRELPHWGLKIEM